MENLLFFNIGGLELIMFLILPTLLWVWALVDVVKSNFRRDSDKIIWLLLIVFASFIGVLLYLLIGRQQRVTA